GEGDSSYCRARPLRPDGRRRVWWTGWHADGPGIDGPGPWLSQSECGHYARGSRESGHQTVATVREREPEARPLAGAGSRETHVRLWPVRTRAWLGCGQS